MRVHVYQSGRNAKISAGNSNFAHKDTAKQSGKTKTSARAITDFNVSYLCSLKQHKGCTKKERTWCQCFCHTKEPQL